MDIFEHGARQAAAEASPLAERMRPKRPDLFVGQAHVMGPEGLLRRAMAADRIFSMILWGPPGCGKTTLARIVAHETRSHFVQFSAVLSGVREIRAVIEAARNEMTLHRRRTILFVDEIHRFNKSQQDAFLHHVESGLITLIGATTENPSFEVIAPLLSRCRVVVLNPLSAEEIGTIIDAALGDPENGLGGRDLVLGPDARAHLVRIADGDGRAALNGLQIAADLVAGDAAGKGRSGPRVIRLPELERALQRKALCYDKGGEDHYNLISAFHKSLRGSDPDAAIYWLERMLMAGEDPLYIARRMVRFASEDVGNADPAALSISMAAMEAFRFLGHPEGELALVQATAYLATAPKSNSLYAAQNAVRDAVRDTGTLPVPLHLRNAPTRLMKDLGYGKGYRYAHDYRDGFVAQTCLPDSLAGRIFYRPTDRGHEKVIGGRLERWRRLRDRTARSGGPPSGPIEKRRDDAEPES